LRIIKIIVLTPRKII